MSNKTRKDFENRAKQAGKEIENIQEKYNCYLMYNNTTKTLEFIDTKGMFDTIEKSKLDKKEKENAKEEK